GRDRPAEEVHAVPARARVGAGPGRGHRAHSRHETAEVPGGERARAGGRADAGGPGGTGRDSAEGGGGGGEVSGGGDEGRQWIRAQGDSAPARLAVRSAPFVASPL